MKKLNTDIIKTLQALRDAGNNGIHSFDLNQAVGTTRSAARVNDLKKRGYIIHSKLHVKKGDSWGAHYTLVNESLASNPITQSTNQGARKPVPYQQPQKSYWDIANEEKKNLVPVTKTIIVMGKPREITCFEKRENVETKQLSI